MVLHQPMYEDDFLACELLELPHLLDREFAVVNERLQRELVDPRAGIAVAVCALLTLHGESIREGREKCLDLREHIMRRRDVT